MKNFKNIVFLIILLLFSEITNGQSLKEQIDIYDSIVNVLITNSNTHSQQITQTMVGNSFTNLSAILSNFLDSSQINTSATLQQVMNNSNSTNLAYVHKDIYNVQAIIIDTAFKYTTDRYTPKFLFLAHSDSGINRPFDSTGDNVWDFGANFRQSNGILDTLHGGIGMQFESLYYGGLSTTIPAQEFHLIHVNKGSSGIEERFLTYAGLEDGSQSEAQINASKILLGQNTAQIGLVNQLSGESSGMVVQSGSVTCYAPFFGQNLGAFKFNLALVDDGTDGEAEISATETDRFNAALHKSINDLGHTASLNMYGSTMSSPGGASSYANNGILTTTNGGIGIFTQTANSITLGTKVVSSGGIVLSSDNDVVIDTAHNTTINGTLLNKKFATDIYVVDYGITNDTTIDYTAQLQNAYNAITQQGAEVHHPSYAIKTHGGLEIHNPCELVGSGGFYGELTLPGLANIFCAGGSIIYNTSLTDTLIKIDSPSVISNMAFVNTNTAGGDVDTLVMKGSTNVYMGMVGASIIQNSAFRGAYDNLVLRNGFNNKLFNLQFYGCAHHNLDVAGQVYTDAGDWGAVNCNFISTNDSAIGAFLHSSGGMKFTSCKFQSSGHSIIGRSGIVVDCDSPGTAMLMVVNSSFENFWDYSIKVIKKPHAIFHTVLINSNQFEHYGATEFKPFIYMDNIGVFTMNDNTFIGANTLQDSVAVQLDSASSGMVIGDTYTNYGTSKHVVEVTYPFTTVPKDQTAVITSFANIGNFNSVQKGINGFGISGNPVDNFMYAQPADSIYPGEIDTNRQTFQGTKVFIKNIIVRAADSAATMYATTSIGAPLASVGMLNSPTAAILLEKPFSQQNSSNNGLFTMGFNGMVFQTSLAGTIPITAQALGNADTIFQAKNKESVTVALIDTFGNGTFSHIKGNTSQGTPTVTIQSGAGVGASAFLSNATDLGGTISITTGTGVITGSLFSITFAKPFTTFPHVVIFPSNSTSGIFSVPAGFYTITTTSGFTLSASGTIGTGISGQTATFDYIVIQ